MRIDPFFLLFICSIIIGSCTVEDNMPLEPTPEYTNAITPKDNHLILSELTVGNSTSYSGFYFSEKSASGGFYVIGNLNGSQASTNLNVGDNDFEQYYEPVLIKYDEDGNKIWQKRPGFTIQRFEIIPSGVLSDKEIIVLTGYDDNESDFEDESPDRSRIMLFDGDGNFIDNYSRDFFLSLFDLKMISSNTDFVRCVGVGSVRKLTLDGNYYPGFYEFRINKNPIRIDTNSIITSQLLDPKWKHLRFWNLEVAENNFIVSGAEYYDQEYHKVHVLKFDPDDYENPVWWSKISNNNALIYHWRGGLEIDGQRAYVCGYYEDRNKGMAGSCNGCYWVSAFINTLNLNDGGIVWSKSIAESELSDRLFQMKVDEGYLYAAGVMSRSWCNSCSEEFTIGNGWLLKLDNSNGDIISQRTFGNFQNRTRFRTLIMDNNRFWCIGQRQRTNSQSRGLLIELNREGI